MIVSPPSTQKNEDNSSIHCGSSAPRGVIYPQSSVEIPVFLLAKATGMLQHSLRIAVFGSSQAPLVSKTIRLCALCLWNMKNIVSVGLQIF